MSGLSGEAFATFGVDVSGFVLIERRLRMGGRRTSQSSSSTPMDQPIWLGAPRQAPPGTSQ